MHGDVKPANLILTRGGHVKLVDFGLSSTPLMLGRRSGTPGYRAPELATGSAPSRASDVYGLAATAFALLTGSPPAGGAAGLGGDRPRTGRAARDRGPPGAGDGSRAAPGDAGRARRAAARRLGGDAADGRDDVLPVGHRRLDGAVGARSRRDGGGARPPRRAHRERRGVARRPLPQVQGRGRRDVLGVRVGVRRGATRRSPRPARSAPSNGRSDCEHRGPLRDPHRRGRAARRRLLRPDGQPRGARARAGRRRRDPPVAAHGGADGRAPPGRATRSSTSVPTASAESRGRRRSTRSPAPASPRRCRRPSAPTAGCWRSTRTTASSSSGARTCSRSVLERLAPRRLLALVGASGSGKSSLLRAGVIASVGAGEVPGVTSARLLTPGRAAAGGDRRRRRRRSSSSTSSRSCTRSARTPRARERFIDALLAHPGPVAIGVRADFYGELSAHPRARARGGREPDPARRDERRRAAPRRHRAGAPRRAAARAGARRRRPRRGRRRAGRPAAALACAARDLGAARRTHAHGRRVPRQRRRDVGRRAVGRRASWRRCRQDRAGPDAQRLPAPDGARRGDRGHAAPGRRRRARPPGSVPGGGPRAARPARRGAARDARRGHGGGRPRGADPRVADAARMAGGGPRRDPPAPPARRRRPPLGGGGPRGRRPLPRHAARRGAWNGRRRTAMR